MSRSVSAPMTLLEATARYEAWLERQVKPVKSALARKHARMSEGPYPFFQATFYRWIELIQHRCPEVLQCTVLPSIGDLHLENFGTWRDREGRLIWGVMDFDHAWKLPWTQDLLRLCTSISLAIHEGHLKLEPELVIHAVLEGYEQGLISVGRPFVLGEQHEALQALLDGPERIPQQYWRLLQSLPEVKRLPRSAIRALDRLLPKQELDFKLLRSEGELGSLGQPRFVVVGEYRGGLIAREAKAMVPAASAWLERRSADASLRRDLVRGAIRSPDPLLRLGKKWQVRRLAPDCGPISLSRLQSSADLLSVFRAMGTETANLHLSSRKARGIREELARFEPGWLAHAVSLMTEAVLEDLVAWREGFPGEVAPVPAEKKPRKGKAPTPEEG